MSEEHRKDHFREFKAHTLLKHGLLERYITAYIQILKRSNSHIWLVDGFAGKGKDDAGHPGSPQLLCKVASMLREEGATVSVIAVELEREWYDALKQNLAAFDAEVPGASVPLAYIRHGKCADWAPWIFEKVGQAPAFFFLDPFGAKGLDISIPRGALRIPRGEVLAFFSHSGVSRHLALLAGDRFEERARRDVAERPSLFPELDVQRLQEGLAAAERSDPSFDLTQDAARGILTALFGSIDKAEAILQAPRVEWGRTAVRAYMNELRAAGATHVTPIAIVDEDAKDAYYLIHAAKHPLATVKLKEALHQALGKSELPLQSQEHMSLKNSVRLEEVERLVGEKFAGQTVRWTGKNVGLTVSDWALAETMMSYSQRETLRERLESRYKEPGRAIVFKFPPSPAPAA
jgi:three-Cys-motif partner protein